MGWRDTIWNPGMGGYFLGKYAALVAAQIQAQRHGSAVGAGSAADLAAERAHQADLFRHIVGNPFRPNPVAHSSSTIVQLADALYDGADSGFALHDALIEGGRPELADHFRQESWHPKGCWALDQILGKS